MKTFLKPKKILDFLGPKKAKLFAETSFIKQLSLEKDFGEKTKKGVGK